MAKVFIFVRDLRQRQVWNIQYTAKIMVGVEQGAFRTQAEEEEIKSERWQ